MGDERLSPNAPQQGIQSLETGIRLFQTLQRLGRPAALSELAVLSEMPPSKTHRYCVSLIRTGLFRLDGRGLYSVGPQGFQAGPAQAGLDHARTLASAMLPGLVRDLNETVFASAWGQIGPRLFAVQDSPRPIAIRPTIGSDLPLHNSATGRIFAAYLDGKVLASLLDHEFERLRQEGIVNNAEIERRREELSRILADIRRRQLSRTTGERHPGVSSFSAPIFDHRGHVIVAFTCFGLKGDFATGWNTPVPVALQRAARELTERIGGANPPPKQPAAAP